MTDASPSSDLRMRRRQALALLASGALFPLSGCDGPDEQVVPYVEAPERVVTGEWLRFATSLPLCGFGRGALVTSWQGRPIKVEGNPLHPASLGATDVFAEATVLELYDPARSRSVRLRQRMPDGSENVRPAAWEAFLAAMLPRLAALEARQGEGLRILTGHTTSPTLGRLLDVVRSRFPRMRHYRHEPAVEHNARAGAAQAFGQSLRAIPHLERAAVIVALDADPLGPGPQQIAMGRAFAAQRLVREAGVQMSRLYAVEPVLTTTGAKADHRIAVAPHQVRAVAQSLAAALGAPLPAVALEPDLARFVQAMADDLRANPGAGVVLAGDWQMPEVHALAHWINVHQRAPVEYIAPPDDQDDLGTITELADDLRDADPQSVLCVLGSNPAYAAPAALDLTKIIANAPFTVHMGLWRDETARLCTWHLPESHVLEDWGDLRAPDGTVGIVQPLIRPLHATRSVPWLLGVMGGRLDITAYQAVRAYWAEQHPQYFEAWWRKILHDGVIPDTRVPAKAVAEPDLPPAVQPAATELTLAVRPDASVFDGRFASNAWLQECPRPITTQVWGNAALLAPQDAAARHIDNGDLVRLRLADHSITLPALIQPGQAQGVVLVALGYGRLFAGPIGSGIGADAYALRRPDQPWYADHLSLEKTGEQSELLLLQTHMDLDGYEDSLLHHLTLDEWRRKDPETNKPPPVSPYPKILPEDTYAWGMVIDNTLCIGCNACVISCQSENNVPIVGPDEIARNRDMHWLRIDTYDIGSDEAPRPAFTPVPCMHCEKAPCEPVCPVEASVHDAEGLNVQVYNRCIGTRFCQSNCPYKVRRFNFFAYADGQAYGNMTSPLVAAQYNPEVTVRARGVMEKCTYCVQRISAARRNAEKENREIATGEVETACQRACPTRAIQFGDLRHSDSTVARWRDQRQHYAMLEHLGTRPRTTYLADIRNPNPKLKT